MTVLGLHVLHLATPEFQADGAQPVDGQVLTRCGMRWPPADWPRGHGWTRLSEYPIGGVERCALCFPREWASQRAMVAALDDARSWMWAEETTLRVVFKLEPPAASFTTALALLGVAVARLRALGRPLSDIAQVVEESYANPQRTGT